MKLAGLISHQQYTILDQVIFGYLPRRFKYSNMVQHKKQLKTKTKPFNKLKPNTTMKNLYRKGKVHPSPPSPPPPPATISDHLALLPATILTLTAALSPQDKEVLAYLISSCNTTSSSCNNTNFSSGHRKVTHENEIHRFDCDCFRCYMSYWVRWDTSPNRQLIHEIIDAYEDGQLFLHQKKNGKKMKKSERRKKRSVCHVDGGDEDESFKVGSNMKDELDDNGVVDHHQHDGVGGGGGNDQVVGLEKVSMRKIVSYIGEKIWGVWMK